MGPKGINDNFLSQEFEEVIGFHYLRAMHLNDSKAPLGSRKDRHENIGKGCIGPSCFQWIMKDSRLQGLPLIMETPVQVSTAPQSLSPPPFLHKQMFLDWYCVPQALHSFVSPALFTNSPALYHCSMVWWAYGVLCYDTCVHILH